MTDPYRKAIANQFEAALCAMNACLELCPEGLWDSQIGVYTFSRLAFHTMFCADYYLSQDEDDFFAQPFHAENKAFFGDYEETRPVVPSANYSRSELHAYMEYCRAKSVDVVQSETEQSLSGPCGFPDKALSRAELHVYNIRHIQHHTGQLAMKLRAEADIGVPWVGSGWRDG